ncbi:MAG: hypothetical protein V3V01_04085 [Acidimicrobiales bacterium]
MSDELAAGLLVWSRQIDESAIQPRWAKFGKWFAAPAAAGALLALLLDGFGAMLGVLILLGGIGVLLALGIWSLNKNLRSNPKIQLVDGVLVQQKTSVKVADIEAWTTHKSTGSASVTSSVNKGMVIFRIPVIRDGVRGARPDGGPAFELVNFSCPEMGETELAGLRDALNPHIAAQWVPFESISDA